MCQYSVIIMKPVHTAENAQTKHFCLLIPAKIPELTTRYELTQACDSTPYQKSYSQRTKYVIKSPSRKHLRPQFIIN